MRIVLDANIYVSAAISLNGVCGKIITHLLQNPNIFELIVTPKILAETLTSLSKPRVVRYSKKSVTEAQKWLEDVSSLATIVPDVYISANECRDPDDVVYLAAADVSKASMIVSGDKDLLVLTTYKQSNIVSPSAFLFAVEQILIG